MTTSQQSWEWRAAGWPRGYDSEVYRRYKDATLQREKRRANHEYERAYVQEVENAGEIDIRAFWYAYNKKKRKIKQGRQGQLGMILNSY